MGCLATPSRSASLNPRYFKRLGTEKLIEIRQNLETVLKDRPGQFALAEGIPDLIVPAAAALVPANSPSRQLPEILGAVLSPTQVRAFLDCSAKWWFKYGLGLPEAKTSSLAFGLAIHRTLEINFREKLETGEDLETPGMVTIFRDAWLEQVGQTVFRKDEDPSALRKTGERLIARYMDEVAPRIQPMAVELEVKGEIAGVAVSGRVDVLDVEGRVVDVKTSSRKPSCVAPDYAFQLATYRQITPDASGAARLDTLVKTQTPQLVEQTYRVGEDDLRQTQVLFPLVQEGIRNGLYFPNRQSLFCSRRHCSYWQQCQKEFGGSVKES